MIRSTGHGLPSISSYSPQHGELSVLIGLLPPAQRSSSSRQHNGTCIRTPSINLIVLTSCLGWSIPFLQVMIQRTDCIVNSGLGGLVWVPVSCFWGRAPVLFWTAIAGLAVTIGSAVAPNFQVYFAMRVLTNFFLTSGQTMSIACLKDIFFFHERARKFGLWAALYISSPYLGPCLGNFVIAKTGHWPDVFWLCSGVVALQIILVICFIDETYYNRAKHLDEQPARPSGISGRISRLTGVWQIRHHRTYFPTVLDSFKRFAMIITRPAFFLVALS